LEDHTAKVDQAKRAFNKASKAVDQVLKDIATKAREMPVGVSMETLTIPHLEW